MKEHKYSIAYCRHYLALKPPSEAPEQAAFAIGKEPFLLVPPTVEDTIPSTEELSLQEAENQRGGDDIKMLEVHPRRQSP